MTSGEAVDRMIVLALQLTLSNCTYSAWAQMERKITIQAGLVRCWSFYTSNIEADGCCITKIPSVVDPILICVWNRSAAKLLGISPVSYLAYNGSGSLD